MKDTHAQAQEIMRRVHEAGHEALYGPLTLFSSVADNIEEDMKPHIILTYTWGVLDAVHNNVESHDAIAHWATEFALNKLKEKYNIEVMLVAPDQLHEAPENPQ